MKLLKNSTYQVMQNRIKMLEKDLEDQLNEVGSLKSIIKTKNLRIETITATNQILEEIVGMADNQIASLKPKAEKWDAELKRQRDKQKRKREKVKLQSGIEKFVTKNLGLKIEVYGSVGHICGYNKNENMIIVGFENNNDSNLKWNEGAINENDTLLVNYNFYVTTPLDINTKIIK